MKCNFCGSDMGFSHSEGVYTEETHYYVCLNSECEGVYWANENYEDGWYC